MEAKKVIGKQDYNYKEVNASILGVAPTANNYAQRGWRVVAVMADLAMDRPCYTILLERPVGVEHPDD